MTPSKRNLPHLLLLVAAVILATGSQAQDWRRDKKLNVLFGLAQPIFASGFNIEGNYIHHRFIFDYSHGANLSFSGNLVTNDLQRQQVAVREPWTTGFGIGYRLKEWINVRLEPKWHKFEFYYEDEPQNDATQIVSYNTFSLGIGVYGAYQPFKKKDNFLKGILIAPSVRFWPTVSSSLKDDKYTYLNKKTNQFEEIKTLDPGTGFSPFVINLSVGYSFDLKKKN